MFDFSKLGDMAKLANEAKQIQEKQEHLQKEQIELLKKISKQMEELINLTKNKN
ncbi:MAG: hypothetical protein M0R48_06180 [Candidatus Omnitrophica bacterium]|jgi:predicted transcriptional regulator|nr:hypothetical protein [Candidatus Omnitrophota bacterium]